MKSVRMSVAVSVALASVAVSASAAAAWPEALADSLSSDGAGYVDLGYFYHVSSFPKTARIVCEIYDGNWGKGRAPGPTISGDYPRTVFGYQESSTSVSIARYNGGKANFIYNNSGSVGRDCGRLNTEIIVDYVNQRASWSYTEGSGGLLEFNDVIAPASDSSRPYYLFANNHSTYLWNGVFTFKNLRVYELNEQGQEVLARDYVACVDKGVFGVYDKVTCGIFPVQNDTNCFSVANARWRLTVGDEVTFVTGAQSISAPAGETVDGWMLLRDSDGTVLAHGNGTQASFTMPQAGVTLHWVRNENVAASSVRTVSSPEFIGTLTLGSGSVLSFVHGGVLTVSEGVALQDGDRIGVSCQGLSAPGTYTLMRGATGSTALSSFTAICPDGVVGTFERRGDAICLRLSGMDSAVASMPDKILDSLRSDGAGYVDLGYKYHVTSYPKTSRIVCDFYDSYWGYGRTPGPVTAANPRGLFGYEDQSASRSIARWSSSKGEFVYNGSSQSGWNGRLDSTVTIDYANARASWVYAESGSDLYFEDVTAPSLDAQRSYYLFAQNSYRENMACPAIFAFKALRIYELTDAETETLAHDFVPAMKGGRPCVYDTIAKTVAPVINDTNCFAMTGAKWPQDVFTVVTQEFASVQTRSYRPVSIPEFAPETSFAFVADGSVTFKRPVDSVSVVSYGTDGSVVSSETHANVSAGDSLDIAVGDASKTVLTLNGVAVPAGAVVIQDFAVASVQSEDGVLFRMTGRHECEFMLPSGATVLFNAAVDEIFADVCDANGDVTGTERIHGHVNAGSSVQVDVSDGTYQILRVKLMRPGIQLIFR